MYDWVIVGAGPAGLSLAWGLSKHGYSVALIERESTIGGLHRVRRVGNNVFTEHGPRIYSTNYLSTANMFSDMGLDFQSFFVKYNFFFNNIASNVFSQLSWSDILSFTKVFIYFTVNSNYGRNITMTEFMDDNNFSEKGRDFITRLCRLTDGAGPDRYTLWEFLQVLNQNFAYEILQPKKPNDIGFLREWENKLIQNGVKIFTNTEVLQLYDSGEKITGIQISNGKVEGKNFIMAIPPKNLVQLLNSSRNQNSFGKFDDFKKWSKATEYNTYIPITFHWKKNITFPPQWGYPRGEWEVAILILSDYITDTGSDYKTLISTCISTTNVKSKRTGKTADQSTKQELIEEVFSEIANMYPGLEKPDLAVISPEIYYDTWSFRWKTNDSAFMLTVDGFLKNQQSNVYPNLYTVGTHTGNSVNAFTSMEAAVSNALHLLHTIIPETKKTLPIIAPITLKSIIIMGIFLLLFFVLLFFYF